MAPIRFAAALLLVLWSGQALAAEHATIGGAEVRIVTGGGRVKVLVGSRAVIDERDDQAMSIQGVLEGNGHAYALIAEATGGNACAAQFQAIEVSRDPPAVSPVFGTCTDQPTASVVGGALHVTMKRTNGLATETYVFAGGRLSTQARAVDLTPSGPVVAPRDDLAAFVAGKSASDLVKLAAVTRPLRRVMGSPAFDEARRMALGGPSVPGIERGAYAVVEACEAHNCGAHHVSFVFDHHGHAWARLTRGRSVRVFGRPPPPVRALLH